MCVFPGCVDQQMPDCWQTYSAQDNSASSSLQALLSPQCCDTAIQRHSAYITGLEEEVSRERSCPCSPGKLAGKSQAGLMFSASEVLGMVLEVKEDKTIANQHKDSDNHCPSCTARKVLFPPTLPAESLRAHKKKKASFILAACFIVCYLPSQFGL